MSPAPVPPLQATGHWVRNMPEEEPLGCPVPARAAGQRCMVHAFPGVDKWCITEAELSRSAMLSRRCTWTVGYHSVHLQLGSCTVSSWGALVSMGSFSRCVLRLQTNVIFVDNTLYRCCIWAVRRQIVEVQSVRDASGNCLFNPAALVNAIRDIVRADKHEP